MDKDAQKLQSWRYQSAVGTEPAKRMTRTRREITIGSKERWVKIRTYPIKKLLPSGGIEVKGKRSLKACPEWQRGQRTGGGKSGQFHHNWTKRGRKGEKKSTLIPGYKLNFSREWFAGECGPLALVEKKLVGKRQYLYGTDREPDLRESFLGKMY